MARTREALSALWACVGQGTGDNCQDPVHDGLFCYGFSVRIGRSDECVGVMSD
jgi:hypothetical protein